MNKDLTITIDDFWQLAISELRRANADKRHPFRNVVLSTSQNDIPSQRTVVMRKFLPDHQVLMYTDARSQKCVELESSKAKAAALLFWHPIKKLQIRLMGQIESKLNNDEAITYWRNIPPISKNSYTTDKPPGTIISSPHDVVYEAAFNDGRHFSLLYFNPVSIELLQLNKDLHLRAGFALVNEEWKGHWLIP